MTRHNEIVLVKKPFPNLVYYIFTIPFIVMSEGLQIAILQFSIFIFIGFY